MPVPFDENTIKTWFETSDVPTQQQYSDWIATMFHHIADLNAKISALQGGGGTWARAKISWTGSVWQVAAGVNVGTPITQTTTKVRVPWLVATGGGNYTVLASNAGDIVNQQGGFVDVQFPAAFVSNFFFHIFVPTG